MLFNLTYGLTNCECFKVLDLNEPGHKTVVGESRQSGSVQIKNKSFNSI